jgi:tRNA-splicing ligase RtcB
MNETNLPPIRMWLAAPLPEGTPEAIDRLRRAPDVQQIAVMPDVHLAADVCVGIAMATSRLIYPQAVGGDIGCGMLAVALDVSADALTVPRVAGRILADLASAVPPRRRNRREIVDQPHGLAADSLSDPRLDAFRRGEGALEFATLGSGNHFIELQSDENERLWIVVHSGSRGIGQAIRDHHLTRAQPVKHGLSAVEAFTDPGAAYLHDSAFARRYADASRRAIVEQAGAVLARRLNATVDWDTAISTDHNHVAREHHNGRDLWVHRKGAMPARPGVAGMLPGSMGTLSFHVEGRGVPDSLCSSAHGAGRKWSRTAARSRFTECDLRRQMEGVWFDCRLAARLRDEAPGAYKDIRAVLRAQSDLVKVTRTLRPILNYKGV